MVHNRFVVAGSFALIAIPAFAGTTHTVTALTGPNRYEPAALTINAGDSVTFTSGGGFHNVVSDDGAVTAFRCANGCDATGGDGTPAGPGWSATVVFPTPGEAPYHCEVHGTAMTGLVTVVEAPIFKDGFDG